MSEQTTAAYFDKRSSEWEKLYAKDPRFARRFKLLTEFITPFLKRYEVKTALDYGCGTGLYSRWLAHQGISVTALDVSEEMLRRGRQLSKELPITFEKASDEAIAAHAPYDAIISLSVLEYIKDWQHTLLALNAAMKPGSVLVLSVPNPQGGVRKLESLIYRIKHATKGKLFGNRGDYLAHQRWTIPQREFDKILRSCGFSKRGELWYNTGVNLPEGLLPRFERPWWAALYAGVYEKVE